MTRLLSLLAGASMLAFASGANAGDLLSSNDMDTVSAGAVVKTPDGFKTRDGFNRNVFKKIFIDEFKRKNIDVFASSFGQVFGNVAEAEALADAEGHDSFTETLSATKTTPFSSSSLSGSLSVSN